MTDSRDGSDFYTREMHYTTKRDTFQSPWDQAPKERIGQPFEIVGVDVSDWRMADGGGGPVFDIRFSDGFILEEADELEVFVGCGWEPGP